MKTKHDVTDEFILGNEYGERGKILSDYYYSCLTDEQKTKYKKIQDSTGIKYVSDSLIPEMSDDELAFLCKMEDNALLRTLRKDIKTIKGCIIFFTVLTVLSLISSIIFYIILFSI